MSANPEKRFFCFRGFMKSGTNWIANLLNLHPDVCCVGELHLHVLYQAMQKHMRTVPILIERADARRKFRGNFQGMVRHLLADIADPAATVIGERTPHSLDPLAVKNVPHITIIRDGRDVLISRIFHLYNFPEVSRVFERFPELQENLAAFQQDPWFFRENPERLLCNEEMVRESMQWWREHLEFDRATMQRHPQLQVLTLNYEDFHHDVEASRRRMYEFLDVDPELADPVPDRLQPGIDEERPNEFNRKGQIGDWKNYFTDQVREWINAEAGEELMRQGYVDSLDW